MKRGDGKPHLPLKIDDGDRRRSQTRDAFILTRLP